MTQGHFDEVVAAKAQELVGVAIERERAFNSFREDAQEFICVENAGGIFAAGEHAAETRDEPGDSPEFEQSGMNQEAWDASGVALDDVQSHHGIPGHEAAMIADQDGSAFVREMFKACSFNAPIIFCEKVEKVAALVDVGEIGGGQWSVDGGAFMQQLSSGRTDFYFAVSHRGVEQAFPGSPLRQEQ